MKYGPYVKNHIDYDHSSIIINNQSAKKYLKLCLNLNKRGRRENVGIAY